MTPLNALSRLRAGWRPDCRDITDCDVVENWQLSCRGYGPYMLQGTVAGQPCLTGLIAIDPRAGWALVQDRLLVLGGRAPEACIAVTPDEVMRRAADAFEAADRSGDIRARTLELAREAQRAGFATAGYMLEMAALEIENAMRFKRGT